MTTSSVLVTRTATLGDAPIIARIYTQGIEDRTSTFETRTRTPADIAAWFDEHHPIVVTERQGVVIAFASSSAYRPRDCYSGIAEFSVYVERAARGTGAGRAAMQGLIEARPAPATGSCSPASSRRTSPAAPCWPGWASERSVSTNDTLSLTASGKIA